MQINRHTYEEFFLMYADGELNESEKKAVEEFIDQNPDLESEFSLIQETVMQPDESIIFENKELLFRDEEEERKVIFMRWLRMAAAAVLLIGLSVTGWIFVGDNKISTPPAAVARKPAPVTISKSESVADDDRSGKEEKDLVAQNKQEKIDNTLAGSSLRSSAKNNEKHLKNTSNAIGKNIEQINNEPAIARNMPVRVSIKQEAVQSDPANETIDMPVSPRELENEKPAANNDAYYAQSFKEESNSNDMIYFANTSFTKKTKLRGVLRKATRYLDRVTSLQ